MGEYCQEVRSMGSMEKLIRFKKEERIRIMYILAVAIITTIVLIFVFFPVYVKYFQ